MVVGDMEKKLETNLKQLQLGIEQTGNILDSGRPESIKRHLNVLHETVHETNRNKMCFEAAKIEADEIIDKINEWNLEIEVKIEQGNAEINRLEQWLFEKE
jgi:uncharacterized protein YaaR (DUF327 family)